MLRPRLPLAGLERSCKCFSPILRRTYATGEQKVPAEPTPQPIDPSVSFAPPPTREKGKIALRTYTPRTPGTRHLRRPVNDHLWKGRPVQNLTFPKKGHGKGGRNSTGRVTVRHRGGGHKRRIRTVDFERNEPGQQVVQRIEHDPGRTAHIALLKHKKTNKLSYIIASEGMREGDVVESYRAGIPDELWESMGGVVDPGVLAAKTAWRGNCLPLTMIPVGTLIYNVGLRKGKGGQLCRGAGTYATLIAKAGEAPPDRVSKASEDTAGQAAEESKTKEGEEVEKVEKAEKAEKTEKAEKAAELEDGEEAPALSMQEWTRLKKLSEHVTLRLQSGEVRLIHKECCATVGVASNASYQYTRIGKAGRSRWLNIRPTVRGVAMNAKDHPHGGGRGKSKGNVHPKSPWGRPVCYPPIDFPLPAFAPLPLMN